MVQALHEKQAEARAKVQDQHKLASLFRHTGDAATHAPTPAPPGHAPEGKHEEGGSVGCGDGGTAVSGSSSGFSFGFQFTT